VALAISALLAAGGAKFPSEGVGGRRPPPLAFEGVVQLIEDWVQEEGFECEEACCNEVSSGALASRNCPEGYCTKIEEYTDKRVGRHVLSCQQSCAKKENCAQSMVYTQDDWENSVCFHLHSPMTDCYDTLPYQGGVKCTRQSSVRAEWLPLFTLTAATDLTYTVGVKASASVKTTAKVMSTLNAGISSSLGSELSTEFKKTVENSKEEKMSFKMVPTDGARFAWQWTYLYYEGGVTTPVKTNELAITAGKWEKPKCLPGYAKDPDNGYQVCISEKYEIKP